MTDSANKLPIEFGEGIMSPIQVYVDADSQIFMSEYIIILTREI